MLAAVGQLCSTNDVAHNARLCTDIIRRAAAAQAKIIYLPEAADFIASPEEVPKLAQPLEGGLFVEAIKKEARESSIWVGVAVHEKGPKGSEDKCYNTQLLISPQGEIAEAYRKLHLFNVNEDGREMSESKTTLSGDKLGDVVETPIGKVGMLTCYDLRFPEPALMLRRKGAQVLAYPAAWTSRAGPAHWDVLLRARAIETQSYILAPGQVGEPAPGRECWGHAMIVSPWGDVIACAPDRQPRHPPDEKEQEIGQFVVAEIELEWLEKIRREIPLWDQRRSDIYPIL
ncbi:hypothetical protein JCM10213_006983 [Rhodosporidiobolus nylandii]